LALQNLRANGADKVTVINRTFQKAKDLASRFSGHAKDLNELQNTLIEADILISLTGAKDYVVTKEMIDKVGKVRKGKPLFMVDIAVPRDLDPLIADIENIFLYDIDDLEGIVGENLQERKKAATKIMLSIKEEIVFFKEWVNTLGVVPVISALRVRALEIQQHTMNSIARKLPHLSERDLKVLNKHTKSIINQMLKYPILQAKEIPSRPDSEEALDLFMKIFNIDQLVVEQKAVKTVEKIPIEV
jgi:glutamyl-tRNA reductase